MATRRMNGMWRQVTLALALCVVLFHSCMGQDDSAYTSHTTVSRPVPSSQETTMQPAVTENVMTSNLTQDTNNTDVTEQQTEGGFIMKTKEELMEMFETSDPESKKPMLPPQNPTMSISKIEYNVTCGTMKNTEKNAVRVELASPSNCDVTIAKIMSQIHNLCSNKSCNISIFHEDSQNITLIGDGVPKLEAMINEYKKELGIKNVPNSVPSKGKEPKSVFVPLLVTGLILAAALIGAYVWKNKRSNAKGIKLANESVKADEENQGNTLVSVAPLKPLETQEKPSLNGESPEAVKTTNPPEATNGHSTTKTADTEL
ncbi:uncharacterized protein cd34 [Hoplias malabaricus]|uniref:uncharacterized protein cd34 n=1 Tax=Hoplias malabaricus TaxID=27720 RepID=UPI0034618E13